MRLKAQIWVSAYIKICAANDLVATVVRHGDDDAGTIFLRINRLDGTSFLFVPAPAGLSGNAVDRTWQPAFVDGAKADGEIDDYLKREIEIDQDIWIVEVESPTGVHQLDPWLSNPASGEPLM